MKCPFTKDKHNFGFPVNLSVERGLEIKPYSLNKVVLFWIFSFKNYCLILTYFLNTWNENSVDADHWVVVGRLYEREASTAGSRVVPRVDSYHNFQFTLTCIKKWNCGFDRSLFDLCRFGAGLFWSPCRQPEATADTQHWSQVSLCSHLKVTVSPLDSDLRPLAFGNLPVKCRSAERLRSCWEHQRWR